MKAYTLGVLIWLLTVTTGNANEALLQVYRNGDVGPFSAAAGETAWVREYPAAENPQVRSCSSCHTIDLQRPGRHVTTGKTIDPLAPSVNPARLTDPAKIEKWFRRNCRWTLGRECTLEEKGDFLAFLSTQ